MQNRGNFVLNKACYLMNIDDTDLCVYPKKHQWGNKRPTPNYTPSFPSPEKKLKKKRNLSRSI